jgi:hypothetical protein
MTATYDYDSDDRRTRKTVNGVVTRTMWSGADELAQFDVNGDLIRRFIPDGSGAMDGRLATVEADGTVYWYHTDHQGSVVATSNSAGQTVGVASYSPYGEFGGNQTAPPLGSPFGYTGREFDPDTGLYQVQSHGKCRCHARLAGPQHSGASAGIPPTSSPRGGSPRASCRSGGMGWSIWPCGRTWPARLTAEPSLG